MSNRYKLDFFKPWEGKGAAFIFNMDAERGLFFVKAMPETANKSFDAKKSINFKIGNPDLGEILAVLTGRKDGLGKAEEGKDGKTAWKGLFHKTENSNSSLSLTATDRGYSLRLSRKDGTNTAVALSINLSVGEACLLLEFIRSNSRYMFVDDFTPTNSSDKKNVKAPVEVEASTEDSPF